MANPYRPAAEAETDYQWARDVAEHCVRTFPSVAARNADIPVPYSGQLITLADPAGAPIVQVYDGGAPGWRTHPVRSFSGVECKVPQAICNSSALIVCSAWGPFTNWVKAGPASESRLYFRVALTGLAWNATSGTGPGALHAAIQVNGGTPVEVGRTGFYANANNPCVTLMGGADIGSIPPGALTVTLLWRVDATAGAAYAYMDAATGRAVVEMWEAG